MFFRVMGCKLSFRKIFVLCLLVVFLLSMWSYLGVQITYHPTYALGFNSSARRWDGHISTVSFPNTSHRVRYLGQTTVTSKPAGVQQQQQQQQQQQEQQHLHQQQQQLPQEQDKKPPEQQMSQSPQFVCRDNRLANYTSCPECFRPTTVGIAKSIQEVPLLKNPLPLQPEHFFEPRKEIVQKLMTNYLIVPNDKFQKNCPFLLAMQMSVLDRKSERDAIRATWASVAKSQTWPNRRINAEVKVLFVVARQNMSSNGSKEWEEIQKEAAEHNDILYINMQDSYRNLTLKILSTFKWIKDFCPCVKFVLKVDQDTFVNVPLLVDLLLYLEKKMEFAIGGMAYSNRSPVHRVGKWQIDRDLYPMERYPVYSSGCAYVVSAQAVFKMADVAPYIPMFSVEDAFITGVLRNVIKSQMFSFGQSFTHYLDRKWPLCHMVTDRKVLGTNVDEAKGKQIWETFVNNGSTCK